MSDSIEKIVAEMHAHSERCDSHANHSWGTILREYADRLASLRQVPEDYVVVPRYPTRDMERAGAAYAQSYGASLNCVAMSVYASMIAAAPKASPGIDGAAALEEVTGNG